MTRILVIDIDGTVDQSGLERLRTHLNLKGRGRLTDDWDQEFGYRTEEASAQRTNIVLFRNFDESWKVSVHATGQQEPSNDELALLRNELVEGITAAGFQATVRAKPTSGSRP
jgi:hypothetical protein